MEKLQELTEKIYREGVEKGRAEAARLVEEAKAEAARIVAEAETKAAETEAAGRKAAEELFAAWGYHKDPGEENGRPSGIL